MSAEPAAGMNTAGINAAESGRARGRAAAAGTAAAPGSTTPGSTTPEAFFRPDGDALVPSYVATSPWGPVLHGRLIGGLTARAVEQARAGDPDLICARMTIDMFRSAPLAPVTVAVRPVRSGRRIAVLEVTVEQAGGAIGQGKAVLLRRAGQPPGTFRPLAPWAAPVPSDLGPPRQPSGAGRWTPPWESWAVPGPTAAVTPDGPASGPLSAGLWVRDVHPLVPGEDLTPLVRLAMAADLVSPVANASELGLAFINADYTVYLAREPQGEYIGIQPGGHISERGVAVGQCVAHDQAGPVGFLATTAVANARMG